MSKCNQCGVEGDKVGDKCKKLRGHERKCLECGATLWLPINEDSPDSQMNCGNCGAPPSKHSYTEVLCPGTIVEQ